MLLNIPVEDLFASQLDISLNAVDGRLSCRLKPTAYKAYSCFPPPGCAGITINLESVQGENGYTISLFASSDEAQPPPSSSMSEDSALFAETPEQHFPHIPLVDDPSNVMSYLMYNSSPPPDYYSDGSYEQSPPSTSAIVDNPELQGELDFSPGSMCSDMSGNTEFDAQQFHFMCVAPNTLSYPSTPPSDCGVAGPSRASSPPPSTHVNTLSLPSDLQNGGSQHFFSSAYTPAAPSPCPSTYTPSTTAASPPSQPTASCSSQTTTFLAAPSPATSATDLPVDTGVVNPKTGRRAQYPCLHPTCERVLTSPYTRQVHMNTHRDKVRKAFLCTLGCGEAFTRQHDRQRHEVALHGKKCKHVCARCKRFFSSAKMLDRHVCRGNRHGAVQWPLGDDEAEDDMMTPTP